MTKTNVTQQVDALIIGTFTSKDWRFSSYGRKIEKAWKKQKKGHHIITQLLHIDPNKILH